MSGLELKIPQTITCHRRRIDAGLKEFLQGREGELIRMTRYHLGFSPDGADPDGSLAGKAIRPCLALFLTEALDGELEEACPAAISLELVHNFSLVHDDIQDGSTLRRGRKSVQALWGQNQAINAGDGIKDLALLAFFKLRNGDGCREKSLTALESISSSSLRMIEGQILDLKYEGREDVGEGDYLDMIALKTCALFECAFTLGFIYGEEIEEKDLAPLLSFARGLGYVFQIRDDWLGIWGEPEKSGKSAHKDLIEKKKSFPVVYALTNAKNEVKGKLEEFYGGKNEELTAEQAEEVRGLLEEAGAREATLEAADAYWKEAKGDLKKVSLPGWASEDLKEFGHFLLNREK